MARAALLAFPALAFAQACFAARPMVTDDARIVDPKSCQLEAWVRLNRDSSERWALPGCNFTGNLELTLGGAGTSGGEPPGSRELVMQAKTLLRTLRTNDFGVGLALGNARSSQAEGHGAIAGSLYGYVPVSVSLLDDRALVHVNAGARRVRAERRNLATWGLGTEIELSPAVYFVGEQFGEERAKPSFQTGFRFWVVPGRVQIDATYGERRGGPDGERWMSFGLRLLSPAFLP